MPATFSDSTLPAQLAERLTDEQCQAVLELPRSQRLKALAPLLSYSEPEALTALSQTSGLAIASNLEADKPALSLFPARLVHDYQIVPIKLHTETPPPPGNSPPRGRPTRS
jgi:hypothetical protein